ncbi:MFS transporter [Tumebacillus permanentifrigoris]|uniref:Putative MFS family arabinose efflux permease n=1 Tax=Tumebacillus permanentifrigoris TaxID=378543 RepID=A0A316DDH1_9BACL|nr:MFS transporter [Tumebacillus permanentifrigoris]PWK13508.1 putative MFS family arabinose efflux permease [Tumebacillus permanentifrigoris]
MQTDAETSTDPASLVTAPTQQAGGLFSPLRQSRNFAALWGGQTLSRFGDILLTFMLPLIVYDLSASTAAMGKIMMLMMLPQVILLPFTGLLVDRLNRVRLMIGTDIVRLGLLLLLAVFSANDALTLNTLYGFAVISGAMSAVFNPAYSAVRAQVFTPEIRNAANSLTTSSSQVAQLIGPSLSGVLIGLTTYTIALGIDALTFLVSIGSLLLLNVSAPIRASKQEFSFVQDLLGGYRELRKSSWLWMTILAFCFINIASGGVLGILLPWLVKLHLGWDGTAYGLVLSSSGVGALVAAFVFGRRQVWRRRGLMAYTCTSLSGLTLIAMAYTESLPLLMLLSALEGGLMMIFGLVWEVSLQELVPEEAFGRVVSLDIFGSIALMPLGYLATGYLAEAFGGLNIIQIDGVLVTLLAAGMLLIPAIRKFD